MVLDCGRWVTCKYRYKDHKSSNIHEQIDCILIFDTIQVIAFFYRICLSGILLALIAYEYTMLKGKPIFQCVRAIKYEYKIISCSFVILDKKEKLNPFFNWALNCAILAIYPALPIVDKDSSNIFLLLIGLGAWTLKILFAAMQDSNSFKLVNFVVFIVGALNLVWIIWDLYEKRGLTELKQIISWILLGSYNFQCLFTIECH